YAVQGMETLVDSPHSFERTSGTSRDLERFLSQFAESPRADPARRTTGVRPRIMDRVDNARATIPYRPTHHPAGTLRRAGDPGVGPPAGRGLRVSCPPVRRHSGRGHPVAE